MVSCSPSGTVWSTSRHPPGSSGIRAGRASPAIHGSCRPTAPVRRSVCAGPGAGDAVALCARGSTSLRPASTAERLSPRAESGLRFPGVPLPASVRSAHQRRRHTSPESAAAPSCEPSSVCSGSSFGRRCRAPTPSPLSPGSASTGAWSGGNSTPSARRLPPASRLGFSPPPTPPHAASPAHSSLFSPFPNPSSRLAGDTSIDRS